MVLIFLIPVKDMFSVRGIGVADQGQYIDVLPQHLDFFLVLHAKALLFIDDPAIPNPCTSHHRTALGGFR